MKIKQNVKSYNWWLTKRTNKRQQYLYNEKKMTKKKRK